jgi:hypothetical protein
MKKLLDGIALLVIMLGCAFEFIITSLFFQLIKDDIELDKTFIHVHVILVALSVSWLFTRAMNNWERE